MSKKLVKDILISLALGAAISGGIHYMMMNTLKMHQTLAVEGLEESARSECADIKSERLTKLCKDDVLRQAENLKTPEFQHLKQVSLNNQEKFILDLDDVIEYDKANMAYVKIMMLSGIETEEERDEKLKIHKDLEESIVSASKVLWQTLILNGISNAIFFSLFIGGVPAVIASIGRRLRDKKTGNKK